MSTPAIWSNEPNRVSSIFTSLDEAEQLIVDSEANGLTGRKIGYVVYEDLPTPIVPEVPVTEVERDAFIAQGRHPAAVPDTRPLQEGEAEELLEWVRAIGYPGAEQMWVADVDSGG